MAAKKKAAKKKTARKAAKKTARKSASTSAGKSTRAKARPRELIDTGSNKLFVRRNARGTSFKEVVDVSKSLAADRRTKSKTVAKKGFGDRGDRKSASGGTRKSGRR